MTVGLSQAVFSLPSAERFFDNIVRDLVNQRSVLVLLPAGTDPGGAWSALGSTLRREDCWPETIWLTDLPCTASPAPALGSALGVEWPSRSAPHSTDNLALSGNQPGVVLLQGLEMLAPDRQQQWLSWLPDWARASQNAGDRGIPAAALAVLAPAPIALPYAVASGPRLAVHWWWAFPSVLETRILCRIAGGDVDLDEPRLWREHVLPSLASGNSLLVEYLWEDVFQDTEHILGRLRDIGRTCGWEAQELRAMGCDSLPSANHADCSSPAPPSRWRQLWACGALGWTPEYGLELNAAALAVLGRREKILHRLWRAQAGLILPLIDQARLGLCELLTRRYGPGWPVRWSSPVSPDEQEEVRRNPLACQWGYIEHLLRNYPQFRSERVWLPLVSASRRARNQLAHYHPLTFADFRHLLHELDSLPVTSS